VKNKTIETKKLKLISCSPESTLSAYQDRLRFSMLLKSEIPLEWPPALLSDVQEWVAETVTQNPADAIWWVWYIVLKGATETPDVLIGNTGFKGPPTQDGVVEIGYAILDRFQRKGYGSEAVSALISWVFEHPEVTQVIAETFPHLDASIKVMEKNGMTFVGPGSEPGVIRYRLMRI
jgi:ribosomal-protein-alanine N-acetyltransferase